MVINLIELSLHLSSFQRFGEEIAIERPKENNEQSKTELSNVEWD